MATTDQHAAMFLQLVFTFQSAAWQHMGKIKNPLTDKVEKDLMQARFSIDMLEMIRAKTEGNLTEEEKRLIDGTISQLQLNYVDEYNKQEAEGKATAEEGKEGEKEKVEAKAEEKEENKVEASETAEEEKKGVAESEEAAKKEGKKSSEGKTKKKSAKKNPSVKK